MDSLAAVKDELEMELVDGIFVTAGTIDTLEWSIAQAAAQRQIDQLEAGAEACVEAGFLMEGKIADIKDPDVRAGLRHQFLINELGIRKITGWRGVEGFNEITPETVRAFLALWPLGDRFFDKITDRQRKLLAAKKECGTGVHGNSRTTPVPNTATDAGMKDSPAPAESPDQTDGSAPS